MFLLKYVFILIIAAGSLQTAAGYNLNRQAENATTAGQEDMTNDDTTEITEETNKTEETEGTKSDETTESAQSTANAESASPVVVFVPVPVGPQREHDYQKIPG